MLYLSMLHSPISSAFNIESFLRLPSLGNWDLGHKIQLTLGDTFLNGDFASEYAMCVGPVVSMMGDWKTGDEGMKFKELAN